MMTGIGGLLWLFGLGAAVMGALAHWALRGFWAWLIGRGLPPRYLKAVAVPRGRPGLPSREGGRDAA